MLRPAVDSKIWRGTTDRVYKVIDPSLVMAWPVWKWGDLLSFAKACRMQCQFVYSAMDPSSYLTPILVIILLY